MPPDAQPDPWAALGLDGAVATPDDVLAARRQLAKRLHPDVVSARGGSEAERALAGHELAMVNRAVEVALEELASGRRSAAPRLATPRRQGPQPPEKRPMPAPDAAAAAVWLQGEDPDDAVFSVPHLPVEAFELVLLAFSAIGDPKVVDEPYLLEGMVDDPFVGFARVELVPEAGGTIVTVSTAPFPRAGAPPPTPNQIAGRLLWEIRALEL